MQDIINDEQKRKKLVIYINPPYAEATASDTISGNKRHKAGLSINRTYEKYFALLGRGVNELFIQFLIRIYKEIPGCTLAEFSTLKLLQGQNLSKFRDSFLAKLEKIFLVQGDSFDNVKGKFPIGFFIWNTQINQKFKEIKADVYIEKNKSVDFLGNKMIRVVEDKKVILNWMQLFYEKTNDRIAYMVRGASDFQNNQIVFITQTPSIAVVSHSQTHDITKNNLIENCIYFAVRKSVEANWLNNQDQFLFPNDEWINDVSFHHDCLAYTLFHSKNHVSATNAQNHWIPFTEQEVNAKEKFASNFMTDFINGKLKLAQAAQNTLFANDTVSGIYDNQPRQFSAEANAVFDAGRALWQYYHAQANVNVNASLYDIREYFQGRNAQGRMNARSDDAEYSALIAELRSKLNALADKIKPKIYEYGFLKE